MRYSLIEFIIYVFLVRFNENNERVKILTNRAPSIKVGGPVLAENTSVEGRTNTTTTDRIIIITIIIIERRE